MAEYQARIVWTRQATESFIDGRYSRVHSWEFAGAASPIDAEVTQLHHAAHEECYIANSVLAEISVAGIWTHG